MTDRELLELAAKAAGHVVRWHEDSHYGPTMEIMEGEEGGPPWNPLTDDGDALRLAVKLEIDLVFAGGECNAIEGVTTSAIKAESMIDNHCAATRRAIVRAAAEIGRSKP